MADVNVNESNLELDRLYESVMVCEPAIDPKDLDMLADWVFSKSLTIRPWRVTALLASKGGEFYQELASNEDKARALATTPAILSEFAEKLRTVADLADCAAARVLVAGCNHESFHEWAAETDSDEASFQQDHQAGHTQQGANHG